MMIKASASEGWTMRLLRSCFGSTFSRDLEARTLIGASDCLSSRIRCRPSSHSFGLPVNVCTDNLRSSYFCYRFHHAMVFKTDVCIQVSTAYNLHTSTSVSWSCISDPKSIMRSESSTFRYFAQPFLVYHTTSVTRPIINIYQS
jgi:hypothetical protein